MVKIVIESQIWSVFTADGYKNSKEVIFKQTTARLRKLGPGFTTVLTII